MYLKNLINLKKFTKSVKKKLITKMKYYDEKIHLRSTSKPVLVVKYCFL